jgi:hypothetical protein
MAGRRDRPSAVDAAGGIPFQALPWQAAPGTGKRGAQGQRTCTTRYRPGVIDVAFIPGKNALPWLPPGPSMQLQDNATCTAFDGTRRIASGSLLEVALATRRALDQGAHGPVLVFDDRSSRPVELDLRGSEDEVRARLQPPASPLKPAARGPGRPKLGVVAREVTLLPRHWDWLAAQPGGASAALRRLVERAHRGDGAEALAREAKESVDRFMQAMTGNLPGHEEASRAFWRGERQRFATLTARWPSDVRDHLHRLAAAAWEPAA